MTTFAEYERYDGLGLAHLVARREVSAAEVFEAYRARLAAVNPRLNAVVRDIAPEPAREADQGAGSAPFRGVPFLLKDLATFAAGSATSFGSRRFADIVARHDSELVARYRRAGLILAGKANTSEFGLVVTTEPALFGPARNPWDASRSTGGSSGGSAAAVAAGIVPWAHATDGGGSIRIPASCCGVFGLKPTRGRTSLAPDAGERNGGFFVQHAVTRSVRDSAALLDAVAGAASGDPYWAPPLAGALLREVGAPVGKLRIALQLEAGDGVPVSSECRAAAVEAARLCEGLGHAVDEVAPCYDFAQLTEAAKVIWSASLAAALDGPPGAAASAAPVEPFTAWFAEIGRRCRAQEYVRAIQAVHAQGRALARLLDAYDVLLTPTLADEPAALGTFATSQVASIEEAVEFFARQFRYSPFTMIANAAGHPAMSVPLHWAASGLPVGTQFVGRFGDEATLFRLAGQLEQARPWSVRRPAVGRDGVFSAR